MKKTLKKPLYLILLVVLIGVFLFAAYQVGSYYLAKYRSDRIIEDASRFVTLPGEGDTQPTPDESGDPECPEVDFDALKDFNSDVVAWLYAADTHINYPVVQAEDNDYYLKRLLDGTWNENGSIFLDSVNDPGFTDQNSMIYGHNMKSGAMFSNLVKFKQQSYYDEHPYFYLLTPRHSYRMHLFAGVIVDAHGYILDGEGNVAYPDSSVYRTSLDQAMLQQLANYSTFRASVSVPTDGQRIVTLSTCTYEFNNVRYVVLGYLEEL